MSGKGGNDQYTKDGERGPVKRPFMGHKETPPPPSLGWSNKGELFILKLTTARVLVGLADHLTIITMTQVT